MHNGVPVKVGKYTIYAGGAMYLKPKDFLKYDLIVPLDSGFKMPAVFGKKINFLMAVMKDFSPPPSNWQKFLEEQVVPELSAQKKILVFCMASHGRTGTFLASLIALLESEKNTPDPIQAVRERHCICAVETKKQAEAIFSLRGQVVPKKYNSMI